MRIAIIGSKGLPATYGGVEKVVERLCQQYKNNGHEPIVFSRMYYSKIKKQVFYFNGVKVVNINGLKSKRLDVLSHSLIALLFATVGKFDVVAIHSSAPALFCYIPKLFGKTVIIHSHGLEHLGAKWGKFDKWILYVLMRFTGQFADAISTVSISQLEICEKVYMRKVHLIPNGIDFDKFKVSLTKTEEFKIKYGNYILFVGRIVQEKGIEFLIEAFNNLDINTIDNLLIVGEPSQTEKYYNYLVDLAKEKANKIKFLGGVYGEELFSLYKGAHFIVIPSIIESFSHTAMESLFYNGAVLCSDIPQFKMMLSGYVEFFETKSVESLNRRMMDLIIHPESIEALREKANSFPFKKFSWEDIALQYLHLYEQHVRTH